MGVHTIGRAFKNQSGYNGTWVRPNSTGTFNNDYYREIMTNGWVAKNVGPHRNQWNIASAAKGPGGDDMMMLNTDICLYANNNKVHAKCMHDKFVLKKKGMKCGKLQRAGEGHFLSATNNTNCCAWFASKTQGPNHKRSKKHKAVLHPGTGNLYCGVPWEKKGTILEEKKLCCQKSYDEQDDCDAAAWPKGFGFNIMLMFARDE